MLAQNKPGSPDGGPSSLARPRAAALFEARSIAVIGASPGNPYTRNVMPRIAACEGMRLHLVNPNRQSVDGRPCHADVRDIADEVDLAFVATPAAAVLDTLHAAHKKGIKAAIVVSAGFSESASGEGQRLADELQLFARQTGMVICGPSCLGLANNVDGRDLFATGLPGKIPQGHIALISQSGGTVSGMVKSAIRRRLGFSHVVSSGGELCTDTCDYFDYVLLDPATHVVCFFLEQLRDPDRFLKLCRQAAEQSVALFCIKIGRSEPGRRAALGHTGSITGQDAYFETLFAEGGVTRCSSVEEMLDRAGVLAQLPRQFWPAGDRLGIVTVSGGTGTLLADLAAINGLDVPPLSEPTRTSIEALLPARVKVSNPVDIAAQLRGPEREVWNQALRTATADFDIVLVADLHPYLARDVAILGDIAQQAGVAIVLASATDGITILDAEAEAAVKSHQVAFAAGAEAAVNGIAGAARHHAARRDVVAKPPEWWDNAAATVLSSETLEQSGYAPLALRDEVEWRRVFAACGIRSVNERLLACDAADLGTLSGLAPPFAVKGLVPGLLHKAKLGLVELRVDSVDAVAQAIGRMIDRATAQGSPISGCIVQEMMLEPVHELYISSLTETGGRPIMTLGFGGGNVEDQTGFVRGLAPVSEQAAHGMIEHLLGDAYNPARFAQAAVSIARLSEVAMAYRSSVQLIEINPLMVSRDGDARVVDTVVVLSAAAGSGLE